ncbi:MAG: HAD-IIB family hydrolase [Archangiaceae bacterium]|nr:HAD-IIB family hydrolase [Archangiaceae bacterium]
MLPLQEADLSHVEAVFTDVDGTLTTRGHLRASTLGAIEALVAAGLRVVLVSGRPAGWGEAWARELPVSGVIVENGGLYFTWRRSKLTRVYAEAEGKRQQNRKALHRHVAAALRHVRGARLSSDSASTEVDLAIDYAEDASLGAAAAEKLERFLRARKVHAVRSSVHVNCWLGDFDKASMVRRFLKTEWKAKIDARHVYCGDSLNDAPMFAAFPLSVGVANVRDVEGMIEVLPRFVTEGREGQGFEELARAVLATRQPARLKVVPALPVDQENSA